MAPQFSNPDIRYYSSPTYTNLYIDLFMSAFYNMLILLRHCNCSVYYALKPAPNNGIPALVARCMGKRILLDIDDLDYGYFDKGMRRTMSYFFFRHLPRFFNVITCHTKKLSNYIVNDLRVPAHKVYFLAQGVSPEFASFDYARQQRIPRSIVYVATLGITSDFNDIVPALEAVCIAYPDTVISVVGDGVRRLAFEQQVAACTAIRQCTFYGLIPHSELAAFIGRHEVGINYMRKSFVNDCRAVLKLREYLACGLQVVCNDTGDSDVFADYVHICTTVDEIGEQIKSVFAHECILNSKGHDYVCLTLSWKTIVDGLLPLLSA
jgi:glycosyltransferase involved in cell wall biosynthesis